MWAVRGFRGSDVKPLWTDVPCTHGSFSASLIVPIEQRIALWRAVSLSAEPRVRRACPVGHVWEPSDGVARFCVFAKMSTVQVSPSYIRQGTSIKGEVVTIDRYGHGLIGRMGSL